MFTPIDRKNTKIRLRLMPTQNLERPNSRDDAASGETPVCDGATDVTLPCQRLEEAARGGNAVAPAACKARNAQ
jgi:hypothetical protein